MDIKYYDIEYSHIKKYIKEYIYESIDNINKLFGINVELEKIIICKKIIDDKIDYEVDGIYYHPPENYIKIKFDEENDYTIEMRNFIITINHELIHNVMNQYFDNEFDEVRDFIDEFNAYYHSNLMVSKSIWALGEDFKEDLINCIEEFNGVLKNKRFITKDEKINKLACIVAFSKILKDEYCIDVDKTEIDIANEVLYYNGKLKYTYNYNIIQNYIDNYNSYI